VSCGSCGSSEWQMILCMRSLCVDLFPLYIKHDDLLGLLKDSSISIFNNLLENLDLMLYDRTSPLSDSTRTNQTE